MELDEVEILLLAHELRLSKFKKKFLPDIVSLNLTHTVPQPVTLRTFKQLVLTPLLHKVLLPILRMTTRFFMATN